jgi:hypothetical protein
MLNQLDRGTPRIHSWEDVRREVEWEDEALTRCTLIVFWVPRDLKTLPGFTTNVEFGMYLRSGKIIYGRPDNAPETRYLDYFYKKITGKEPENNLHDLLKNAVQMVKERIV